MRKKILLIALIAAGAFSVSTVAQQSKGSNNCPEKECTATKDCKKSNCPLEGLNLTDAQKAQIKVLNGQMCDSRKELRDKKQENAKEIKTCREAVQTKYNEGLKKILTPDQYTQYLEKQLQNRDSRKGDRYRNKGHKGKMDRRCPNDSCPNIKVK